MSETFSRAEVERALHAACDSDDPFMTEDEALRLDGAIGAVATIRDMLGIAGGGTNE